MQIHDLNTDTPASDHYIAMDSGADTYKAKPGDIVPSYTSGDASSASSWSDVTAVGTGLKFSTLINRITTMMKNVRFLKGQVDTLNSRTQFSTESVTGTATSIASNGTTWVSVPLPSTKTAIAVVGYYLSGGTACSVYAFYLGTNSAQIALRNYYSSTLTVTATAYYLCIG